MSRRLTKKMITAEQIRAARSLLRWSARDLADRSGIGWRTVQRLEAAIGIPSSNARTLNAIKTALETGGIVFIDRNGGGPGVRLKE